MIRDFMGICAPWVHVKSRAKYEVATSLPQYFQKSVPSLMPKALLETNKQVTSLVTAQLLWPVWYLSSQEYGYNNYSAEDCEACC